CRNPGASACCSCTASPGRTSGSSSFWPSTTNGQRSARSLRGADRLPAGFAPRRIPLSPTRTPAYASWEFPQLSLLSVRDRFATELVFVALASSCCVEGTTSSAPAPRAYSGGIRNDSHESWTTPRDLGRSDRGAASRRLLHTGLGAGR